MLSHACFHVMKSTQYSLVVQLLILCSVLLQVVLDESAIAVFDGRVQRVRRRGGEKSKPECLQETVKFPQTIMVWGAISVHGTSRLPIVDLPGIGLSIQKYQKDVCYLKQGNSLKIDFGFFKQDSAPCHMARPWPGNFPDMNPIENLWSLLKDEIQSSHYDQNTTHRTSYQSLVSFRKNQGILQNVDHWHAQSC